MSDLYSEEVAPQLFEPLIERDQTELPDDYLPGAPGMLPAGKDLLHAVAMAH